MLKTELEQRIADILVRGTLDGNQRQDMMTCLARLLPLPKDQTSGAEWCIDDLYLDDMVFDGNSYRATGSVWWLSGGGEYGRYSADFDLVKGELEYCFVFYKETKNRNRVRLMSGRKGGESFVEFFEVEGGTNWWESTSRNLTFA